MERAKSGPVTTNRKLDFQGGSHLDAILIDDDAERRTVEGVLGRQMNVGDPFKIGHRNIWYKRL
ncbi:MAG: hypothetical protein EXS38_08205 [Opitutus sp.]|nr:hypothetical protein [Opitutus sp.]